MAAQLSLFPDLRGCAECSSEFEGYGGGKTARKYCSAGCRRRAVNARARNAYPTSKKAAARRERACARRLAREAAARQRLEAEVLRRAAAEQRRHDAAVTRVAERERRREEARAARICRCGLPWVDCLRARESPERAMRKSPAWVRFSRQVLAEHRARHGDVCPGFRREAHPATILTVDHITPLALGGDLFGPTQVLCVSCNSRKAALDGSREVALQRRGTSRVRHGWKPSALAEQRAERRAERAQQREAARAERERRALERLAANARTCTVCGAGFIRKGVNPGLFCSNACKGEARRTKPGDGDRCCARCSVPFTSALATTRYCSRRCAKAAGKARARRRSSRGGGGSQTAPASRPRPVPASAPRGIWGFD